MTQINTSNLLRSVYLPEKYVTPAKAREVFPFDQCFHYSLGRHAIKNALIASGSNSNSVAFLPSFICRDVLAPFNELNIKIEYYDVDKSLRPILSIDFEKIDIIFAVNYFGFPQDLTLFSQIIIEHSPLLIEDNAHGLFSKDKDSWLGTRGDCGIYSFRKTLPIPNGGGLLLNNENKFNKKQIEVVPPIEIKGFTPYFIKSFLRPFFYIIGGKLNQFATKIFRFFKKLRTGHEITPSCDESEVIVPKAKSPVIIENQFQRINISKEINRRRDLYLHLEKEIKTLGGELVFSELSPGICPYGVPFYAEDNELKKIKDYLYSISLEAFPWPDLPKDVIHKAPSFYKKIWLVRFLW